MQFTRWGRLILLSLALTIVPLAGLSAAQTTPQLERLQVDLWPEFDQPNMLVIYRGTLAADTPLPATLTLRLPARVGEPFAVAYDDGSGGLLEAGYSTSTDGNWLAVTLETPAPNFQLEYYDSLDRAGEQRSYTFGWPGDYAVEQLSVLLLPPPGATEIQTQPLLSPVQGDTGATTYVGTLGGLAAGQEAQVTLSYLAPEGFAGTATSRSSETEGEDTLLIVGVGVAVLALVIGGALWYTRQRVRQAAKKPPVRTRRPKGKRRPPKKGAPRDRSASSGFCTQCGRQLRANDRFCGGCGTPAKNKSE